MAVIQQKIHNKITWWEEIEPLLTDSIYLKEYNFYSYFKEHAKEVDEFDIYPIVTIRKLMHAFFKNEIDLKGTLGNCL